MLSLRVGFYLCSTISYQLPGRTGIVKSGILGGMVSRVLLLSGRRFLARAMAIFMSAPLIGWIYQSSCSVIFWKRLWK
jgi:hypothetical protein